MVLLQHACVFFWRFLESRNYKIQVIVKLTGTNPEVRGGAIGAPYEPPRDRIRPWGAMGPGQGMRLWGVDLCPWAMRV